jgi:Tfp pilus assembly protein PilO
VKKQVPLTPVLGTALAIVVAVAWFALIAPKQRESAALDDGIAELQTKLATAVREEKPPAQPKVEIDVADVFRLAKAMPDREDMPGVILELNSLAVSTGVRFLAIQPGPAVARDAYHSTPVTLTFEGNYYDLTDFLFRLRSLVSVRDGVLTSLGRLYALDAIEFHEAEKGFPQIQAVLTVSAYSYGAPEAEPGAAPATAPPPAATAETTSTDTTATTTTETTTTPTTTSPAPSSGSGGTQQAAGGTG